MSPRRARLAVVNLATELLAAAERAPESIALDHDGTRTGYGALAESVRRLAGGFVALGVEPGARVAIVAANQPDFVTTYLATLWLGAVAVPLNPTSAPGELRHALEEVEATLAVVGPAGRDVVTRSGATTRVLGAGCELQAAVSPWSQVQAGDARGATDRDDDDLAVLLYTAGTAGRPKAAMLSHGNLAANIDQVQAHPTLHVEADDVGLAVLPFFHIFGLNTGLGVSMSAGASQVLVTDFDPRSSLLRARETGCTLVAGVPAMWAAWCEADAPDDSLATVRAAFSGAAPLSPALAQRVRDRFGIELHEGYGLTEASPVVTSSGIDDRDRGATIGPPLPGVEVRLVDADGHDVLVGDPGEVWVRGPNVFSGYWHDDEATRRVLTDDGWLRTGDVAVAGEDGWLSLVDRAKDLVIVSGFNVYPAEVEDVLRDHPRVAEAAVVGVDDDRTGEAVVAYVVPTSGATLDEAELREFCTPRLARYKVPSVVEIVSELPRNLVGKVLRRALREEADDVRSVATTKPT